MYGYIYKTTNLITGKIYVGQHKAKTFDKKYFGSGKYLKNALTKYGKDNFKIEVLCECDSFVDLNKAEVYYIDYYNAVDHLVGYNICIGGQGTPGHVFNESERALLSKYTTEMNLARDPEIYRKVSESAKGNKMMNNGEVCRRVHPRDFEAFLQEGWTFGGLSRKGKYKNRHQPKHANCTTKGKIAMTNGVRCTFIDPTEELKYTSSGWQRGLKIK